MDRLTRTEIALIARQTMALADNSFLTAAKRLGIDSGVIDAACTHAGFLAATNVAWLDSGRFSLAAHIGGQPNALVFQALESNGTVIGDFVAVSLQEPDRHAVLFGCYPVLGAASVVNPASYFGGDPLPIYRAPFTWLRAGCRGAVVLSRCGATEVFGRAAGDFLAEDESHGRELVELFSEPRVALDRIFVRRPGRAAA